MVNKIQTIYYSSKFILSPTKWAPPERIHLCQGMIQSSKHFLNAFSGIDFSSRREFSFMSSIDWKRGPRSGNLSFGKRKKSGGAISSEYGKCSMIFVEFLAFKLLSFWRKFRSFETSQAARRFMPKQSFKIINISFTLAMLTWIEDVDGRPERGKSSTTSQPLLNALYHSNALVSDKVDSP